MAGIARLVAGNLTEKRAIQALATLAGAILPASARGDPALFDRATADLG